MKGVPVKVSTTVARVLQRKCYENCPGMEWWERFKGGLLWPPNMELEDMN